MHGASTYEIVNTKGQSKITVIYSCLSEITNMESQNVDWTKNLWCQAVVKEISRLWY